MSKIIYENNDIRVENAEALQKRILPEGAVYISPWGTKFYYSKSKKTWHGEFAYKRLMDDNKNSQRVPKFPNNKGEGSMSSKKWVWAGVIVAVITVVIWLYRKLTKEDPSHGESESGL